MSTRCQIHFVYDADDKKFPSTYRHSDGDLSYEYRVVCGGADMVRPPSIQWRKAPRGAWTNVR